MSPVTVAAAGDCPAARKPQPHTWTHDGESADLVAYRRPDTGVGLAYGHCRYCQVSLLAVGPFGGEFDQLTTWLELAGTELPEQ